jgi:hypothetical protein
MKKSFIFGMSTLVLLAGFAAGVNAADVSGYANIWTVLSSDDAKKEFKSSAEAEVDFQKTDGKTTVRVDVDLAGTTTALEQAKVTRGLKDSLSFTAGMFNTPIGLEKQDAPDKWQTSNGQLFGLRPANVTGVMLSWWGGPAGLDVYAVNDFRAATPPAGTDFDNSLGLHGTLKAGPVDLDLGYITTDAGGAGDVTDVVLSTKAVPNTIVAFELLSDDNNDGWGLTANHTHGQHGLTVRYDTVEKTPTGSTTSTETSSLTVALLCSMWESVGSVIEWKSTDMPGTTPDTDMLSIQWVAKL